jgi:hypothetical protein
MARRRSISLAALSFDRSGLSAEELAMLDRVLDRARRHVLDYPPDHVLSRSAVRLLASWGEPAPRKARPDPFKYAPDRVWA